MTVKPKRDPVTGQFKARTYDVTVWNITNGDVEHYESEATQTELEEIESNYDEPIYQIEFEENDVDDF